MITKTIRYRGGKTRCERRRAEAEDGFGGKGLDMVFRRDAVHRRFRRGRLFLHRRGWRRDWGKGEERLGQSPGVAGLGFEIVKMTDTLRNVSTLPTIYFFKVEF